MDQESPASDLDQLTELMVAEREQEIIQATTVQGQIVALVMILRDKGLLTEKDVDAWEKRSEEVQKFMVQIVQAQEEATVAADGDDELEAYRAAAKTLDLGIQFSTMLGCSQERLSPLRTRLDEILDMLKEVEERKPNDQPPEMD